MNPLFLPLLTLSLLQGRAHQRFALPRLSPEEGRAILSIQAKKLEGTLFFLASDELEGRDTPSRGLRIAGRYIASRFLAAGLEGLGPKGSFFLENEVSTVRIPQAKVRFRTKGGKALRHLGLLQAPDQDLDLLAAPGKEIWLGDLPKAGSFPAMPGRKGRKVPPIFLAYRAARRARAKGAKLCLLRVSPDSSLVARARGLAQPKALGRRGGFPIPVLLVPPGFAPEEDLDIHLPALVRDKSKVRNVAAILRGSDPEHAGEALVFSAHMDHIGLKPGAEDPVFNGADDDASGCAGVIALAEAFASLETPPKRSLIFVTFWGEEKGLLGSRAFLKNSPWPKDKIIADINIEMIGRPEEGAEGKIWMTGWGHSNLGTYMAQGARRARVRIFEHPKYSEMLYGASDNRSFVQQGIVAHSFSAGSLHSDYHGTGDEYQKLDFPHMEKVVRGLFAGALPIAQAQLTPR
ncbi:MAG TPA: M28 family peptidase [Planctomycetes bacterium]|nr:M28 family peptidase [Planctomycetota bacterium]